MLKDIIEEIRKIEKKYNDDLERPLSDENALDFSTLIKNKFNYELPNEYVNLLKIANGIEFNGLEVYSADNYQSRVSSFIDMNETWNNCSDDFKNYIFFADGDIEWFCYDLKKKKYLELDKPSGEIMVEFNTFEDMIIKALKSRLHY